MSTFETKYEVIPAQSGAHRKTYKVGNKEYRFNGHNAFYVSDPGVAKELETRHGGLRNSEGDELRVMKVNNFQREAGHSYSFSMPRGNWRDRIDWSA